MELGAFLLEEVEVPSEPSHIHDPWIGSEPGVSSKKVSEALRAGVLEALRLQWRVPLLPDGTPAGVKIV